MQSVATALTEPLGVRPETTYRVVTATVQDANPDVAVLKVRNLDGPDYEAVMPINEWHGQFRWAKGETYRLLQLGDGVRPMLSATRAELIESLFDGVSPEVRSGQVRIMGIARAAGSRAKVAVAATEVGIDPVASLVGRAANRVRAVMKMIEPERIDVVAWHDDPAIFLANALAPAQVSRVVIKGEDATAYAPPHQMSAAVGGGGLNSQLAGQLLGVRVTIEQDS